MSDNKMSEILKTSLDGIKDFTDVNTSVGSPIQTPSGVTVIPISKVSIGFATGGIDFVSKKLLANQNFGGGGGTGISVTPIAFLTVDKNANVNLIHLSHNATTTIDKALSLIESSPEIVGKIKDIFS